MPRLDNYRYFQQRALAERARAEVAPKPEIAAIHEQLAEAYEALVSEIEARLPLRLVGSSRKDVNAELSASAELGRDDQAASAP